MRRLCLIIVAVEKQQILHVPSVVCGLGYPACKRNWPYYFVTCGLSGCIILFDIVS